MSTLTSPDGTTIAYTRAGDGPPLVLVDGAMCFRGAGPMDPLAALLEDAFTVYTYDRRGRGESTDTLPYAVEREVEDLAALVDVAGGSAGVYAMSSGGALALAIAATRPGIPRLALYEPPYVAEAGLRERAEEYTAELTAALAEHRRGDAVAAFMSFVGVPAPVVAGMRAQPGWERFEAIAPTLGYDNALMAGSRVPRELTRSILAPALVVTGGASPSILQTAGQAVAELLPACERTTLDGQTHDVEAAVLAPVLREFFLRRRS
ncbi:alpha/beta fold hydrolase [Cellulomonas sp. URHD0024]|uniref:alpha/beta fold hydrolase n=1 Tax=Cellulomonas sp. URHD0024 TaxID=1302620 RepID=UPI00040F0506|nr:alpha/beta fold hydrolase [Cellulomonas sp. URHD0024]